MSKTKTIIYLCTLIGIFSFVSGCAQAPKSMKPMGTVFTFMPKNTPAAYQLGWQDGCETGLSSMTNDIYRTFYKYKMNVKMVKNKDYYRAWKDTFNFCRHYAYGMLKESGLRMKLPNDNSNTQPGDDVHSLFNFGGPHSKSGFFSNPFESLNGF